VKPFFARIQALATVAGALLLIWLAAPLLVFDGRHLLESTAARLSLLIGIALIALQTWAAWQHLKRRRNSALFQQLQDIDTAASDALSERFATAMNLLRSGIAVDKSAVTRWWRRRRQVYQLPWYVFIGAPGAGKTTALRHAGLRFPLAERIGVAPVAGIGGTRQCDWWFTDQAVFIDTAGRYTTQDSHAATDLHEWQTFLKLLRRHRPVQPINGVIVTVSVPDLLQGGAELEHQATAVDHRLQELRSELGLSFPVYVLVTKMDLLAGFVEYFGDFDAAQREQVWGITLDFPALQAGDELAGELARRLAELPARIAAMTPRRLQEEPLPERRAAIYHFAAQVQALLPALEGFVRRALHHAGEAPVQSVRGVHLSSGTQEGNPIDRVLGELSRSYGMSLRTAPRPDNGGKAYFLTAMLQALVIAEAPLAGNNLARQKQRRWLVASSAGAVALVLVLACLLWGLSYRSNAAYVAAVRERVDKVVDRIDPAKSGRIDQLLPLYATLEQLAAIDRFDPAKASWGSDFGLFQGPRLARSAEQTYHRVLDETLAPVFAKRLSQTLRQTDDPTARYEALRIRLMLSVPARLQRDEVRRWAARAFSTPAPAGATPATAGQEPGAGEKQEWLRHLDMLLERNAVLDAVQLDEAAVKAARTALADISMEQRVHERLLLRASEQFGGEQTLAELASAAAVLALAPADAASGALAIPAVYTRQAWRDVIDPNLDATIARLTDEAGWVLGERLPAAQSVAGDALAQRVAQRHARAAIAQWDRLFATLQLQVPAGADSMAQLTASLGAANSPLRQLLARFTLEFAETAAANASPATVAYDAALAAHFGALRDYARGAGAAAIDKLVVPMAAALREPAGAPATTLGNELRAEAARAPQPMRAVWNRLADAMTAQQRRAAAAQIENGLGELAQACRKLTADRFPFSNDALRDMPLADFARLFGPNGMLDSFFRQRLASQVDTRSGLWRMSAGQTLPPKGQAALHAFETADNIRRLFFPAGADLPLLRLQVTPLAMDPELLLFSIDVDGQLLRYENGPRRAKALVWPGPGATQKVLLRTLPAGPSGVGAEVHEGPWALLRVLQRRGWRRGSSGAAVARLDVDGRALDIEVATDGPVAVGLLNELARFRCPEPW
jgi:type VI secretion system protein ImpL